jgi:hypothetical protein
MTSAASKAARTLDFPVDDFKRSYTAAEVEDLVARNWRRAFPTSAGRLPVDLRCKSCGAVLPLPPAERRWCDPGGRATQSVVFSLRSAGGGDGCRGSWPEGENGPQGEARGERKRQVILYFNETDGLLKWHWFCRGEKDGRDCRATPVWSAAKFEQLIDREALRRWPQRIPQWIAEGRPTLVVEVG